MREDRKRSRRRWMLVLGLAGLAGVYVVRSGRIDDLGVWWRTHRAWSAAEELASGPLVPLQVGGPEAASFAERLAELGRLFRAIDEEPVPEWLEEAPAAAGEPRPSSITAEARAAMVLMLERDRAVDVEVPGVDGGDVVRAFGERVAVLRRGRVFVLSEAAAELDEGVDAPEGMGRPLALERHFDLPRDRVLYWDELFVHRRADGYELVVAGIGSRGTVLVRLDPDGDEPTERLDFPSVGSFVHHGHDVRVFGDTLVAYVEKPVAHDEDGARRVRDFEVTRDLEAVEVERVLYAPLVPIEGPMVHSFVRCDLAEVPASCRVQSFLGSRGASVFFSGTAAYLWYGGDHRDESEPPSAVVRLPHDGGPATALRTHGLAGESSGWHEEDGVLHVAIGTEGWEPLDGGPRVEARLELFSVPIATFDTQASPAPSDAFRARRAPAEDTRLVGNYAHRWVGGRLAVVDRTGGPLLVVSSEDGTTSELRLDHRLDRLEAVGDRVVGVGGTGGELSWTLVALDGTPRVLATHVSRAHRVADSELQTFEPRTLPDGTVLVGLPDRVDSPSEGEGKSRIELFRMTSSGWDSLGALVASPDVDERDGCRVSCGAWYRHARPIVWRGRLFGLMGYELVEARVVEGRVEELGRTDFLPEELRGVDAAH
ncbi:MAG: hypothetical protein H6724_00765 [Sandaracinus sp.]|nr:hypothetical protein [Sandaracinus sp.]